MAALNPASLHHYAIGPLIASAEDFKWHVKCERKDGTVTREEAEKSINDFQKDKKIHIQLNTDKILAMSKSLGICFKVEGRDDTYMFPALLPPKDLSVMWKRDESKKVYVGRRQVCNSQTTIFSPSAFGMFQSKVCTTLDEKAQLWRNGLIVSQGDTVSNRVACLVAMVDPVRSVDFVCRGGKATEAECVSLLDTVMSLWRDMLYRYSQCTEYETEYLSRKHLEEHKELKEVAVYSEKEIKEAKAKNKGPRTVVTQVVGDELVEDSLADLLVILSSKQATALSPSPVVKAVIDYGVDQWYSFGKILGYNFPQISAMTHNKASLADKLSAIIQVKTEEVDDMKKMDDLLLEACALLPDPIHAAVKRSLSSSQNDCSS